jgi:hypothetical protein
MTIGETGRKKLPNGGPGSRPRLAALLRLEAEYHEPFLVPHLDGIGMVERQINTGVLYCTVPIVRIRPGMHSLFLPNIENDIIIH